MGNIRSLPVLLFFCAFSMESAALALTIATQDAGCGLNNGHAIAYVDTIGGVVGPIIYQWGPGAITGQGTEHVSGLAPGEYFLTISDGSGATVTGYFTIIGHAGLFADGAMVPEAWSCFGSCDGNANLWYSPVGGSGPYTWTIDPYGPTLLVNENNITIGDMCAGFTYQVIITDQQGCSGTLYVNEVLHLEPLELIEQNVTASCPDGLTGGMQLLFNRPVAIIDVVTGNSLGGEASTWHDVDGIPPGDIHVLAVGPSGPCFDTLSFWITIPVAADGCGNISGTLFADLNGDCVQQEGEPGIPHRTIVFGPEPLDLVITDQAGNYSRGRTLGIHQLELTMPGYQPICPGTLPVTFEITSEEPLVTLDLAMSYEPGGLDAYVHLGSFPPKLADTSAIWLTVKNDGPYEVAPAGLQFTFSALQSYTSSSVAPDNLLPTGLHWQLLALAPFSQWQVAVRIDLPLDPALIGEAVTYQLMLLQDVPDLDPANDVFSITHPILAAYDPNDKIAMATNSQSLFHYYFGIDDHIDYTIRFQNTGNVPAQHVHLIDTISDMHSLTSLQILAASHVFEVQWQEPGILRFDLPQIMLPDSASNPMGSQGFVSFRLRHLETLTLPGYAITNTADIFFDQNPPIRTNTTELIATEPTGIAEGDMRPALQVYPNPARDHLFMEGRFLDSAQWEVLGVDGRRLLSGRITGEPVISIAALSSGSYVIRIITSDQQILQTKFIRE